MRFLGWVIAAMILCATQVWAAPKKDTQAETAYKAKMAKVDDLAKNVFKAADHNHNDTLSKNEFPAALEMLNEGLLQMGNQNVLGTAKNGQLSKEEQALATSATSRAPNLSKNNRITLSEFQLYAHGAAAQADVMIAQNKVAQQQYMQQNQRGRGRGRQVKTGTPVFLSPLD
jgi:hypothetical protein